MMSQTLQEEYYQALLDKNSEYDGVFYAGITTTGIFCHPTCPARKPKFEHCIFFDTAQAALLAGFRPCKRCRPLSHPNRESEIVQQLVGAVENQPDKKWRSEDVRMLHVDPSTARRQFKKRFGMTFIEYARARRLGLAMEQIKNGKQVIDAQIAAGYESGSGFRDAFERIMGSVPSNSEQQPVLKAAWLDTLLGPMVALASEDKLRLLEFVDRRGLEREIERLRQHTGAIIIPGDNEPLQQIRMELHDYFAGELTHFSTPVAIDGTPMQNDVWEALLRIPFGETRSYSDIALAVGKPPTAARAVAQANGANQLAIIIPCHRVIRSSGDLAGYAGGVARKSWLLQHEKSVAAAN
ncbi:MAG: bifunctional transcriptional activator/DNA repair protein Ada [Anaerolineaceae bacterium]|nr:bifunctional transcriptional activator/DNA repair protein Ada [Anaerolineaceae bacterium]